MSEPQRYSMHVEYWRNEYIVEAREIDRGDWIKHEDFIAYKEQHERECLHVTDQVLDALIEAANFAIESPDVIMIDFEKLDAGLRSIQACRERRKA